MKGLFCASSKHKNKPEPPADNEESTRVREPIVSHRNVDPRAYAQGAWSKVEPLPSPYPQGQIEIKQLIEEDGPSFVEPSPELVPNRVEGYFAKRNQLVI